MRVALVHDFLKEYGGAERVLEVLHEIWPEAPIYTAFVDYESLGPHAGRIRKWNIKTTWAQYIPFITKLYSPLRILAPLFWKSLSFKDYDVVISSSSVYFGKGITVNKPTIHISYCHTPPRFLYGYPTAIEWRKYWWGRLLGSVMNHFLRLYDFAIAQRVDYFIANSQEVQTRIRKFYRRDSVVIYPPVDLARGPVAAFPPASARSSLVRSNALRAGGSPSIRTTPRYFLVVSRLARAKRIDLAIEACNRLKLPLKIMGAGREEDSLKKISGPTIEFLGEVNDEGLADVYQNCQALIFPAEEEDFGIVPVEAASFGKPVIAFRSGGVVESVIDPSASSGREATGLFFSEPTVESLVSVLKQFDRVKFDSSAITKHAQQFSKERFVKEMTQFVKEKIHARTS